jgi:hypothetical protein
MDVAGEQQIDVVNNVVKTRLSLDGRRRLGVEHDEAHLAQKLGGRGGHCGPCFPHLHEPVVGGAKHCCNSCEDVKKLYASLENQVALTGAHGHVQTVHWEEHPICQHEAVLLDPSRLVTIKEGCNLFGFLEVNKVAGNFHVAPGKAFQSAAGQLVHEFKPFDTHTYNVSHSIHSLSFGLHYPHRVNPLDGATAILRNGSGVFQYFVKVVPTTYHFAHGGSVDSCQYSVTDQFKSGAAHTPRPLMPSRTRSCCLAPTSRGPPRRWAATPPAPAARRPRGRACTLSPAHPPIVRAVARHDARSARPVEGLCAARRLFHL